MSKRKWRPRRLADVVAEMEARGTLEVILAAGDGITERPVWRCAFPGCCSTTRYPGGYLWENLSGLPGLKDGLYCPAHAEAIEQVKKEGGFDGAVP